MSPIVVLTLLAVALVLFSFLKQRALSRANRLQADRPFSPDLERGLATIEVTAAGFLRGRAPSEEELGVAGLAVQKLYQHFSLTDGTDDNSRFSPPHRASFYLYAVKVAALGHPDHNAWPLMASIRRNVQKPLLAMPGALE